MKVRDRRLKDLRVDPDILAGLLRTDGTRRFKITGMPADATIVGCYWKTWPQDILFLRVRSAEFPEVPDGDEPPQDLCVSIHHLEDWPP